MPESEPLRHARLLRLSERGEATVVEVMDAWNEGQLLHRYLLVPRTSELPSGLPAGTVVRTPLCRAVAFSSLHAALAIDLGAEQCVGGVCDVPYIVRSDLRRAVAERRMADMGSSVQPDVERLIAARPDALLMSPFENAGHGAPGQMDVPLIECADYMESTPLGRAEWMKFYGRLFGVAARADSLFAVVEAAYDSVAHLVRGVQHRPRLMCDVKQGSAWYVPGGDSYLARLYADAGADYLFADRRQSGSVALSVEEVVRDAGEADVWLIKYGSTAPLTYASLAEDYPPYRLFRPWRERHIYSCNTLSVAYYEETPFRPDRLLRDVVRVLHPALLPAAPSRYWQPLP